MKSEPNNRIEFGRLGCAPYVAAAILGVFGPAMAGLTGWATLTDVPMPSDRAVTGTVSCGERVAVPFGEPACVARVTVTGFSGGARSSDFTRLLQTDVGSHQLSLQGDGGAQAIDIPARTAENSFASRWHGCPSDNDKVRDISAIPVAKDVKTKFNFYHVSSWPIRPGDRLTVDLKQSGAPSAVWCGDPAVLSTQINEQNSRTKWVFGGLASVFALVSVLILAAATFARRRTTASLPAPDAPPEAFVAWVAQRRTGRAHVVVSGRQVTVVSVYRRNRAGSLLIEMQTAAPMGVGFIVRNGALGALGRAIDDVGGQSTTDGAPLGYPGVEIINAEHLWSAAAQESVRAAVTSLLNTPAAETTVSLVARGGTLRYAIHEPRRGLITSEMARAWLQALVAIADAAEQT